MPSVSDVRKAKVAMAKRRADYEYFFNQLKSPKWIPALLEEGFLTDPPTPVREGNFIRFPFWPESQYLARMAASAPDLVVDVSARIQTDNPRVQEDIVDVALRVPQHLASKLVPNVIIWVRNRDSRWITNKFSQLVRHLALGGERDSALSLAKEILWFDPDPKLAEKRAERAKSESIFPLSPEPEARAEEWEYQQVLEHAIPALAELDTTATIDLLCSVLERHIVLSGFDRESHQPFDGSVYWRSAIEAGRWYQNYTDFLVDAIRDTATRYLEKTSASFDTVEAPLVSCNWDIFTRIRLYLMRKFPALAGERVARALTEKRLFSGHEFTHEYFCLIQEQFSSLSDQLKQQILEWIDEGPGKDLMKSYGQDWNGSPVGQDIIDKRVRAWKRDKLHPIRDSIPNSWRKLYDELINELGEPHHAEFEVFHDEPQWGPTSPKSEEELSVLSTDSIIEFLESWQPQKGWTDPSPEGLAREFQAVVKRKPNDLSAAAPSFEKLDPTYVRALISGLSDAVKENKQITWKPVLDLCRWVLGQQIEIPGRTKADRRFDEGDPDWSWTRKSIAHLLRDGCAQSTVQIPIGSRTLVWELISTLTNDLDPSVDYENRAGSMRPITLSINTTRGEAMHAVMAYASWVNRNLPQEAQKSFTAMPEVASLLEKRLLLEIEPTLTIRSVYGQNLVRLMSIDREWVTQHEDLIFPPQAELRRYWETAWSSYIIFNRCYAWAYDVLEKQYARAIGSLSEGGIAEEEANPNESLTDHLMILYWIGHLKLDDAPLREFYNKAPEELRAHALEFVGRALKNSDNIASEQIERLKALWESRFAANTEKGKKKSSKELAQFAVWFWSGKFDDDWALQQLIASMKSSDDIEREFFILERLTRLSSTMPRETLIALDLLIRSAHRKRDYFDGRDEAKAIIENGLRSLDSGTRKKARQIANFLLSLRYSEFRDLALTNSVS
jgi:hypothetical protein